MYLQAQSNPVIPNKLFNLHMAVYTLLEKGRGSVATDALQLCSLLLSQPIRMRLHRLLRMMHKAYSNNLLHLSESRRNRTVVSGCGQY